MRFVATHQVGHWRRFSSHTFRNWCGDHTVKFYNSTFKWLNPTMHILFDTEKAVFLCFLYKLSSTQTHLLPLQTLPAPSPRPSGKLCGISFRTSPCWPRFLSPPWRRASSLAQKWAPEIDRYGFTGHVSVGAADGRMWLTYVCLLLQQVEGSIFLLQRCLYLQDLTQQFTLFLL